MISPEVFHRLRTAQHRAAHEQHILSGRDWLLVAFFVQLLAALYPLFTWIHHALLGAELQEGLHPGLEFGATLALAVALLLTWLWARYAPFRASVTAVIVFVVAHGAIGYLDPSVLLSGAVVKSLVLLGLLQAMRTGYLRHRAL